MHSDVFRKIGANLAKARAVKGLSQSDIAEFVGVSYQQIQKYESGHNRIPLDKVLLLSEHLKTPLLHLFENVDVHVTAPAAHNIYTAKETQRMIAAFTTLPKEVRQSTLKMLEALAETYK